MKNCKVQFFLFILIFIFSCKGSQKNDAASIQEKDSIDSLQLPVARDVYVTLPSPIEMLEVLSTSNQSIDPKNIFPLYTSDNFINTQSRALALGIYSSDLAFVNLSSDKASVEKYLQNIVNLLNDLKIYGVIDNTMHQRIRNNMKDPDSLSYYSLIIYQQLIDKLESSRQNELLSLILIGASIETFYLAQTQVKDYKQTETFVTEIYNSREMFNQYYQYIQAFQSNQLLVGPFQSLHSIKIEFDKIEIIASKKTLVKKPDGTFRIEGGYKLNITEPVFKKLQESIFLSRKNLLENYLTISL